MVNKKFLSETDVRTPFVTPSIQGAGEDPGPRVWQKVTLTAGSIALAGKLTARGRRKRADYLPNRKPNMTGGARDFDHKKSEYPTTSHSVERVAGADLDLGRRSGVVS